MSEHTRAEQNPASSDTLRGDCFAMFAFDLGLAIDLDAAEPVLHAAERPRAMRARRPSPAWFDYDPPPIRATLDARPVDFGPARTDDRVEVILYDFGALLVSFRVTVDAPTSALPDLADRLDDNQELLARARELAAGVLDTVRPAVTKPELSPFVEDYLIFAFRAPPAGVTAHELLDRHRRDFAGLLFADDAELAPEQVEHALSVRMSYGPSDLTLIGWNAAVVIDEDPSDIVAVLRHTNVELLEMRLLDAQLDELLERAGELLGRISRSRFFPFGHHGRELRRFAEVQADFALLFEGVNNAIKLVGDQYLARLYRTAAERLHLPEWDTLVLRKLATADSIYQKMTDAKATQRLEAMELIIIILIAISIVMPFIPGLGY